MDRVLHFRMARAARELHGIDIDARAVALLQQRGVPNLHVGDVQRMDIKFGTEFDLIVAGEIIEHLPDPGGFLRSLLRYMGPSTTLVLTTPNLLAMKLTIYSLF